MNWFKGKVPAYIFGTLIVVLVVFSMTLPEKMSIGGENIISVAGGAALNSQGQWVDAPRNTNKQDVANNVILAMNGATLNENGAWTDVSDKRLKKFILDIEDSLEVINKLRPRSFEYKKTEDPSFGFIAQEVEEVIPEVITTGPGEEGLKSVSYSPLTAISIGAIQELDANNKYLESRIAVIENKLGIIPEPQEIISKNTSSGGGSGSKKAPITCTQDICISMIPSQSSIISGGNVTFNFTITNGSSVDFESVIISDEGYPQCNEDLKSINAGKNKTSSCVVGDETENFTNTAVVSALDAEGNTYSDTASVTITVGELGNTDSISITKTADNTTIQSDAKVEFTIVVTNTGGTELTNVTVLDAETSACDKNIGTLQPGEEYLYTCKTKKITEGFTNTATVEAFGAEGNSLQESASESITVEVAQGSGKDKQQAAIGSVAGLFSKDSVFGSPIFLSSVLFLISALIFLGAVRTLKKK